MCKTLSCLNTGLLSSLWSKRHRVKLGSCWEVVAQSIPISRSGSLGTHHTNSPPQRPSFSGKIKSTSLPEKRGTAPPPTKGNDFFKVGLEQDAVQGDEFGLI